MLLQESLSKEQMEMFEIWNKIIRNTSGVISQEETDKLKCFSESKNFKQVFF